MRETASWSIKKYSTVSSRRNGCKLLVLWTERTSKEAADLTDFMLATQKAA